MKCQVTRSPSPVALSGQFLVRTRRLKDVTRGILRRGAMVDSSLPGALNKVHGTFAMASFAIPACKASSISLA